MAVTLTGRVFQDSSNLTHDASLSQGIAHVFIALEYPDQTFSCSSTDEAGFYRFSHIDKPGLYILHETVVLPNPVLPSSYPLPSDFTGSTTARQYKITITSAQIEEDTLLEGYHFGHDLAMPFDNAYLGYQIHTHTQELFSLDLITGKSTLLHKLSKTSLYSALSFNPLDSFLYGYDSHNHQIFRLDLEGHVIKYTLSLLPQKNFTIGDITTKGEFLLYAPSDTCYYRVDVNVLSPYYMQLVAISPVISPLEIEDWSFNPLDNLLYAINSQGLMLALDPYTSKITTLTTSGNPPSACFGCCFDYNGHFYGLYKHSKSIYRFSISPLRADAEWFTLLTDNLISTLARCFYAPLYLTLGSAPDNLSATSTIHYTTLLAHNGPRHGVTNRLFLGNSKEDTAFVLPDLCFTDNCYSYTLPITNNTGRDAYLYAWIDFDRDGLFSQNEAISPLSIPSQLGHSQNYTLKFTIPKKPSIHLGASYMRIRLTTDSLTSLPDFKEDSRSIGPASDGDIVDIPLNLMGLAPTLLECTYDVCELNKVCTGTCQVLDPSGSSLQYTIESPPLFGLVSIQPHTGVWEYTPAPDYIGTDSFAILATSTLSELSCSVPVTLTVTQVDFTLTQMAYPKEAKLSDLLSYTSVIENTGTFPLTDLLFMAPLPEGLSLIPGSVFINEIQDKNSDPQYGIFLSQLGPGELYKIRTDYLLELPELCSIHYQPTVEGKYLLSSTTSPRTLTKQGSLVTTLVRRPHLTLDFSTHVEQIFLEDTVQYTVLLTNTGDVSLQNIQLTAILGMYLLSFKELIINYSKQAIDLTKGYIHPILHPGEQAILQFNVKLTQSPDTPSIDSCIHCCYEYTLGDFTHSHTLEAHYHALKVCIPSVELTKSTPKKALSLGETFIYTLTAFNHNDFIVDEVTVQENYPSNFQVLELRNEHGLIVNTLSSGVSLGAIAPHTHTSLYVKLKVVSPAHSKTPFTGAAKGSFTFTIPSTTTKKTVIVEALDPTGIFITDASLTLHKSVSVSETALKEIVTYTLLLTNTGTVPLNDITVQDLLAPELKFITKSVKIGTVPIPEASIISGITLVSLGVDCVQSISFDAQILSCGSGVIENTATAYYTYVPHSSHVIKSGQAISNNCHLPIRHPHLTLTGQVTPSVAYLGDLLHYDIFMTNDGDTDIFNVLLENNLNSCDLIEGSFMIHEQTINSVDFHLPINVGTIKKGETLPIRYSLKVSDHYYHSDWILNIITAKFAYTTIDQFLKTGSALPLELRVPLALSTFKQLHLENTLEVPEYRCDIDCINHITGNTELLKHYIISTPKGTSLDGQILSGSKLIVHALLHLTVEYVHADSRHAISSLNFSIPFSTFIVLPVDYPPHARTHIDIAVQNIAFKALNNRSFFTHIALLVSAKNH